MSATPERGQVRILCENLHQPNKTKIEVYSGSEWVPLVGARSVNIGIYPDFNKTHCTLELCNVSLEIVADKSALTILLEKPQDL